MSGEKFTFEGLGDIEARLGRLKKDAAYLVIQDSTVPKQDETLARFDLTEADALPCLDEPVQAPALAGKDAFFADQDGEEDDEDLFGHASDDDSEQEAEEADDHAAPSAVKVPEELIVRAACRWGPPQATPFFKTARSGT